MQFNISFKTIFEYILKKLVLCIQIRFVSTEKTTRIASRASCYMFVVIIVNYVLCSASDFIILYVFSSFFFFRKNYLLLSCATSVRLSVRPSVCPSVRLSVRLSSVEIFSFCGNSLSSKPIDLKIGLNVREGVVHVRKA